MMIYPENIFKDQKPLQKYSISPLMFQRIYLLPPEIGNFLNLLKSFS